MAEDRRRPDGPRRRNDHRERPRFEEPRWEERPDWGGVARRGAARVDPERRIRADRRLAERRDLDRVREPGDEPDLEHETEDADDVEVEEWILEEVEPVASPRRAPRGRRAPPVVAPVGATDAGGIQVDLSDLRFGDEVSPQRAARLRKRVGEAAVAYAGDRYGDAMGLLRPIADEVPGSAAVRELLGLAYYRQGRWNEAFRELRAFNELTGSTEQHPILADCARALGNHGQVEVYWDALARARPDPDVVAEGRIVMAGSLADRGRIAEAISLLDEELAGVDQIEVRHLRVGYVRADLYERAGDLPAARSGFGWITDLDPDFADAARRLAALS